MTQLRNTRHGVAFNRPLIAALLTIGMIVPSVGLVQTAGAVESAAPAAAQTSAAAAQADSSKSGAQRTQGAVKKPAAKAAPVTAPKAVAPQKMQPQSASAASDAKASEQSTPATQPAPAKPAAAAPAKPASSETPAPAAAADEEQTAYYHFYTDPDSEASDQAVLCTVGKPIADCYGFANLQGTKDGYTFAGWYDNKDLSGSPIDPNSTIVDKGWAAFYAKWTKNETAPAVDKYALAEQDGTVVVVAPAAGNATIETNLNEFLGGYEFAKPVLSDGQWTIQATLGSDQLSNGWTMVMSKFLWLEPPVKATDFDKSWDGTNYTATFTYDEAAKAWKLTTPVKLAVKTEAPKPKTFTLTFETNGGSAIAPQQVQEGGTYYPDEPTREGYTFTGWFADKELTKRFDLINFKIEQDTTVYAGWTKDEPEPETAYYHFYTDPDSEASDQAVLCTVGKPIADCYGFANLQGTKDGYTFAGWYDNKDLSGSPIDPNSTIVDKGWAAFYAKWTKNEPEPETVYYHFYTDPDSEASDQSIACTMGKTIAQCPGFPYLTVDKPGYTFAGWYASKDLSGDPIDPNSTIVDKGWAAFYAKWTKNETKPKMFTLTFETNGGSAIAPQQVQEGGSYAGDAATTRDGYTFAGWFADKELTKPVDLATLKLSADTTVYAKWTKNETKPKTFTLTFETNGGSAIAPQQVQEGGSYAGDAATTRDGYTFAGWFADEELTKPVDLINFKIEQDTTVYAKWTKNETKPQQPGDHNQTKPETKPETKPSTKPASKPAAKKPAAKKATAKKSTAKKTTAKKSTKKLSKTGSSIASIAFVAMALAGAGIVLGRKRAE